MVGTADSKVVVVAAVAVGNIDQHVEGTEGIRCDNYSSSFDDGYRENNGQRFRIAAEQW